MIRKVNLIQADTWEMHENFSSNKDKRLPLGLFKSTKMIDLTEVILIREIVDINR